MEKSTQQKRRLLVSCCGLLLASFGGLVTVDLLRPNAERALPSYLQSAIFFVPAIFAAGCALFLRGFAWGTHDGFHGILLISGLLMLAVGACPWIYASYLIGGGPESEGAGMLGTLIFISIGLPGLVLVLMALLALQTQRKRTRRL
jgi:hypothetical protein